MKKHIALITILTFSGSVHASGIPVVDVANVIQRTAEHIVTIEKWINQANQMTQQFEQLRATRDALTGIRTLGAVLDNPALNQYLPDDWNDSYRALQQSGLGALAQRALAVYENNHVFDACAVLSILDVRKQCEYTAIKVAKDAADADAIFAVITARLGQIRSLQALINTTADTKDLAGLSARIQTEQAMIANEQMRLDALRLVQDTDRAVQEQRQREFAARSMSATKGTTLVPLTFD